MTGMQQAQPFTAGLTPLPTAARVTRARGALRWRIISTFISLGLLALFWWLFGSEWSRAWTIGIVSFWVATSALWLVISVVGLSRAKKDLARIGDGVAFHLDARGVEFVQPAGGLVPWADVTAVKLVGRNVGAGPDLVVEAGGQQVARVPLRFLDVTPSTIDSAVSAYSLGQIRLDSSALDKLL